MNEPHARSVIYEFGDFRLEPARRALTRRDGQSVEITTKAFDALVYLVERAGTVVTRAQLTQALWPRAIVEDNNLHKLIAALRRVLDDREERHYVVTLQGRGYQFVADVRIVEANALVSDSLRSDAAAKPEQRLQDTGDPVIAGVLVASGLDAPTPTNSRLRWAVWSVAVVLGAIAAWSLAARFAAERPLEPVYVSTSFPGLPVAMPFGGRHLAISNDGSRIALLAQDRLWVRRLRDREGIVIDKSGMTNPFFSPNGESIGFADNGLMKVSSDGGTPTRIAATTARPAGASWGADGTIVFATTEGLFRVGENGGEPPQLLAKPSSERGERLYAWPQFLPNGAAVLFTVLSESETEPPQIFVLDLRSLESRPLLSGAAARYVPTGHLVYVDGAALKVVEFDLDEQVTHGEPFAPSTIDVAITADNGAAEFALSDTGTLLFLAPGTPTTAGLGRLAWVDRHGKEEDLTLKTDYYQTPRISPDGTRVALEIKVPGGNRDIWTLDLGRANFTRLTTDLAEDITPLWSEDSQQVFFGSFRGGNFDVYSQPADRSSDATAVTAAPGFQLPLARTPNGDRLVVYDDLTELSIFDLAASRLEPLLHAELEFGTADVSPDGHWIAYESMESTGQFEVFLQSFPDTSAQREKVSIDGGRYPRWGPDSAELYYVTPAGDVMVIAVETAPSLRLGTPTKLFELEAPPKYRSARPYDLSPDGRFLVVKPVAAAADDRTEVGVVLDWLGELRAQ